MIKARASIECLNGLNGVDVVDGVVVVLLHARADRQDVRVEDHVVRIEAGLLRQ